MKIQSEKQSAEVPVITGGLAMGRGYLGAFVLKGGNRPEKERAAQKEVVELGIPIKAALNTTFTH